MKLREKNLANPRNICKGISQYRVQSFARAELVRRESSARDQAPVKPENEFVEQLDDGLAQAAETHLCGACAVLQPLTGDHTGNFHRLRQRRIDVHAKYAG